MSDGESVFVSEIFRIARDCMLIQDRQNYYRRVLWLSSCDRG